MGNEISTSFLSFIILYYRIYVSAIILSLTADIYSKTFLMIFKLSTGE